MRHAGTKHDEHDWDATQIPVMIESGGKHLIAQADRNGFFYVIDSRRAARCMRLDCPRRSAASKYWAKWFSHAAEEGNRERCELRLK